MCHVICDMCHMSPVTRHIMCVTCYKCQCNSEAYERHSFFGTNLSGVFTLYIDWEVFSTGETSFVVTSYTL